jgi:hypothetical protein
MIEVSLSLREAEQLVEKLREDEAFHDLVFSLESTLAKEYEYERGTRRDETEQQEGLRSWFDGDDGKHEQGEKA